MGQRKGYKQTPEHIQNRIKHGENHQNWKGDNITERSGRCRAKAMYPDVGPCVECGSVKAERHHNDENTRNNSPENIIPLCRRCHTKRHPRSRDRINKMQSRGVIAAAELKRQQTQCKRGHELAGDNLFITSEGKRGCKSCRKIHKRTYYLTLKARNANH